MDSDLPAVILTFFILMGISFVSAICATNNVFGIEPWWIAISFVSGLAGITVPLAWLDRIR